MTQPKLTVAYEEALIAKWQQIRPGENAALVSQLLKDTQMVALVQIAFEAGRDWQSRHPQASVDFPDYGAPAGPKI